VQLSLKQFKAFSAVAQLGSFVEASRSLNVTPAALSLLIRDMEDELGFRLFERTTRRVGLSHAGQQYFQYAERVLEDVRRAEQFAHDLQRHSTGVVRIAMTHVMNWVLLPALFRAFQQRWPQVRIDPVDVPTHDIVTSVESGLADLAVSFRVPVSEALEITPLFTSRVHAVVPQDHEFADRKRLSWKALIDQPIVFIGQGSELRIRAELPENIPLRASYEANNTVTALGLVASGAGVAICAGYLRQLAQFHGLHFIPLEQPVVNRSFVLYRHQQRAASPAVQAFRDFLVGHFAALGDGPVENSLPFEPRSTGP
jgi:DNA-binding transcriptional LysR family regulator